MANSIGVSRRAVSMLLNSLVEKKYVIKTEEFVQPGVKYCKYRAAAEFFPRNNADGGMENISQGRKNFPRGGMENSAINADSSGGHPPVEPESDLFSAQEMEKGESESEGGMENISQGRKNFPRGGMENISQGRQNFPGGMENSAININSYINKAAAASPPNSEEKPPPGENAAAAPFSAQEIREAALSLDKSLVLDKFYPRASSFMAQRGLGLEYLAFIYKQTGKKDPDRSFRGMFYTLFFAEDMAEMHKTAALRAAQPPPPVAVECPVCGARHVKDEACPTCGLAERASDDIILLYRKLREFPPEKREEFLKRQKAILAECSDLKDFVKHKSMMDALKREFGLEESA